MNKIGIIICLMASLTSFGDEWAKFVGERRGEMKVNFGNQVDANNLKIGTYRCDETLQISRHTDVLEIHSKADCGPHHGGWNMWLPSFTVVGTELFRKEKVGQTAGNYFFARGQGWSTDSNFSYDSMKVQVQGADLLVTRYHEATQGWTYIQGLYKPGSSPALK